MLHLGACPRSLPQLLAAKDNPDISICEVEMSQTEVLRTQIDNLRLEVQRLGVENTCLREEWPEAAAEIDWESRYRGETERLAAEIQELRQLLHASQESEARVVGEAEAIKRELEELKSRDDDSRIERLEKEIQQLTDRALSGSQGELQRAVRAVGAGERSSRTRLLPEAGDGVVQVGRERAAIG